MWLPFDHVFLTTPGQEPDHFGDFDSLFTAELPLIQAERRLQLGRNLGFATQFSRQFGRVKQTILAQFEPHRLRLEQK